MGFNKTTVDNGADAISLLQSGETEYCAIVLDLMMPRTDGYAVVEYLKSIMRLIPVVGVTAPIRTMDRGRLDPLLVKAVVTKPFDLDKLQAAVEAACESLDGTYRTPTNYESA
jgi:CheY-like chemotaxis protein